MYRHVDQPEQVIDVRDAEGRVLEHEQHADVKDHGKRHDTALLLRKHRVDCFLSVAVLLIDAGQFFFTVVLNVGEPQSDVVDRKRGRHEEKHQFSADCVEKQVAEDKQYPSPASLREDLIEEDSC